jgi:hypothetical protein
MTRVHQVRKETGRQPMTRSASDIPRRTPPSNRKPRTASGPRESFWFEVYEWKNS